MASPRDKNDPDEPCVVCGEWNFSRCDFCGDALCEDHVAAVPGYPVLSACADCLRDKGAGKDYEEKHHAEAA